MGEHEQLVQKWLSNTERSKNLVHVLSARWMLQTVFNIYPSPEEVGFNATGGMDLLEEQEQAGKEREDLSPSSNSLI